MNEGVSWHGQKSTGTPCLWYEHLLSIYKSQQNQNLVSHSQDLHPSLSFKCSLRQLYTQRPFGLISSESPQKLCDTPRVLFARTLTYIEIHSNLCWPIFHSTTASDTLPLYLLGLMATEQQIPSSPNIPSHSPIFHFPMLLPCSKYILFHTPSYNRPQGNQMPSFLFPKKPA